MSTKLMAHLIKREVRKDAQAGAIAALETVLRTIEADPNADAAAVLRRAIRNVRNMPT